MINYSAERGIIYLLDDRNGLVKHGAQRMLLTSQDPLVPSHQSSPVLYIFNFVILINPSLCDMLMLERLR